MDFVKLFEEDANLNQGEFVTLLSEQHWVEIRRVRARGLGRHRRRGARGARLEPRAPGCRAEARRKHDPTKSLVDVDAECARGAQFAISSNVATQCELGAVVDVDMFKTKLHCRLVKRADNFDLKALLKFRAPPEQSGGRSPGGGVSGTSTRFPYTLLM